jgi:hypothetical protein
VRKVNFQIQKIARSGEDALVKISTTKDETGYRTKMKHEILYLTGYGLRSEEEIREEASRILEIKLVKDVVREAILQFARIQKLKLGSHLNALTFRTDVLLKLKKKEQDMAKEVLRELIEEGVFTKGTYALTQKGYTIVY